MIRLLIITILVSVISAKAIGQNSTPKEKAQILATEEFSKTKYKRVEKGGVVKELKKSIVSTPVIKEDVSFYNGNYVYQDLNYKIEIRTDTDNKPMATLKVGDGQEITLKNVAISNAYFYATKQNEENTTEIWEGAFIDKNDDGNIDFGLGIKLAKPIKLTEGLSITRIFLKKVSP